VNRCPGCDGTCDSVGPKRPTSLQGEVEPIEGVLVRTLDVALTGASGTRAWFAGHRQSHLRVCSGGGIEAGRLGVEPVDDRERQILRRYGVGSPSPKAQRVGGTSLGSTPRRSYAGEASAIKTRTITEPARGANHLPASRSRRSTMVPRCVANGSWGAHRANRPMRVG
jgi:hypothetical protein